MKKLSTLFLPVLLGFGIFVGPFCTQPVLVAQKQGGKANNKKKTVAQKKREAEQKKKARERVEAERKRKAAEEMKRKKGIEDAKKQRLLDRVEEAKAGVRKCSIEAKGMAFAFQKMLEGRDLIARSINLIAGKPARGKLEEAKQRLLKIEEQFKSKGKDIQSAALSLEKVKNSEKKTQHKGGTTETWEKTLLDLKRETSSVSAALKSGQSYNKSYARLILGLVREYVQGGVEFSEQDKTLIKRLGSL